MIVGVGIDILDIRRIDDLLNKFSPRFEQKYFTIAEREFCNKRVNYASSFAKIFSIKEAVIKAIKDKRNLTWHGIEVFHDKFGAPNINVTRGKYLSEEYNFHVSTSDEYPYVVSYAVLEKISEKT